MEKRSEHLNRRKKREIRIRKRNKNNKRAVKNEDRRKMRPINTQPQITIYIYILLKAIEQLTQKIIQLDRLMMISIELNRL